MNAFGQMPLNYNGRPTGSDVFRPRQIGHSLCAEGVRLRLPDNLLLTDSEAKRLAWGILNDLAPDEVIPVPVVVTYKEAQRLAVMRALIEAPLTINEVSRALGWSRRATERRLHELKGDGRLVRLVGADFAVRFGLAADQ